MTPFILGVLILLSIVVFFWTCKTSLEPFTDMETDPAKKDIKNMNGDLPNNKKE